MKATRKATYLVLATAIAFAAYVRLAPADPARWHVSPALWAPVSDAAWGEVTPMRGGASLRIGLQGGDPQELLAQLDKIALATPRTIRIAGSVNEGMITWETRSLVFGFPDYTTAEARADGLFILARQRFGANDHGVNAARLSDWLSRL